MARFEVKKMGMRGLRPVYNIYGSTCGRHLERIRLCAKALTKMRMKAFTFADRSTEDLTGQFLHTSTDSYWKELYIDLQWWALDYWLPRIQEYTNILDNDEFCKWDFENSSFRWMEQRADKIYDTYYQPEALHSSGVLMRELPTFQHLQEYRLWIKSLNRCWYYMTEGTDHWLWIGERYDPKSDGITEMLTMEQLAEHDAQRVPGTTLNFVDFSTPYFIESDDPNEDDYGIGSTPSEIDNASLSGSADWDGS